ncbi:MAG: ATP-binding cassette domain-containing protein, partial [Rhizobiales bacterium]|nr:ATP-binding cassette domain-containing protein [Hyphomicrobiales bacterium]
MAAIRRASRSVTRSASTTSPARPTASPSPASPPPRPRRAASRVDLPEALLTRLREGGKRALAEALARIEALPTAPSTIDLLDQAYHDPKGHVIGITGPPGVGKSTLIAALIGAFRQRSRTVGVIAVDPSSRRSGGA